MPQDSPLKTNGSSSLGHMPSKERWEFDESVVDVFDDMLRRSIPQYSVMRTAVNDVARRFAKQGTDIIDLGCSRGEALDPLIKEFGDKCHYVGCDVSQPMLAICRERYADLIQAGVVDVRECDLRRDFPPGNASVILSILTLQFTPIEYRRRILEAARGHMVAGGVFILVEKVFGRSAMFDRMLEEIYLEFKARNGYSQEEIARKKLSLEGVLVPLDADQNYNMLKDSGFSSVECFWRWMNFAAWAAVV